MWPAAFGANAPIFQCISGSGAERKTIQNLGYGLPKIPLVGEKGSQETMRFLAHLWLLSVRAESNPPEAKQRSPKRPQRRQMLRSAAAVVIGGV